MSECGMRRCSLLLLAGVLSTSASGWSEDGAGPIADHLERAQSYESEGKPAMALLEFEQAFTFDGFSPYLTERAAAYAGAAEDFLKGDRLSGFGYLEAGGGHYREQNTRTTDTLGIDPVRSDYWRGRAGGGLGFIVAEDLSMDATLDYRHVDYADSDIRDDKDLRWRGTMTRSLENGSQSIGVRGRASYRGSDGYRHDYGVFINRNFALDSRHRLLVEGELRTRQYPEGREQERSRDIGEIWLRWTRALLNGRAALQLSLNGGREWETHDRSAGDQSFYGTEFLWTHSPGDHFSYFLFGLWEHNAYHEDIPQKDDGGMLRFLSPDLDIYELAAGLTYEFAASWTLRPEVRYLRDEGNTPVSDYESVELWMTFRRAF